MSLGLARRKELQKRRNQRLWMFFKMFFFLAIVIGSSYFAFDTGQEIALRSMVYSKDKFEQQTTNLEKMRIELGNTEAALSKIQKLLPNAEIQNLLVVANQKAADGINPKRMTALITGLSKNDQCAAQPLTKRFIVSTPVSQQANSAVSFYRGLITVSGKGSPTLNEDGNPEAWFDPLKQITVIFTLPGGETQKATGILPLYHSVIVTGKEYRFTIISDRKSFADITVISCDL